MAKISGEAFIIIGIIVAVTSFFIDSLHFFVFVGIGFIIYGGGKLIYFKLKGEQTKKPPHHKHPHSPQQHRLCPYCNRQVRAHDNFCSNCGALLKHEGGHVHLNQPSQYQQHNRDDYQVRGVP